MVLSPALLQVGLDGLTVAVDAAGEGPPVVLVHGGLSTRTLWHHQVGALADGYRVLAYDLRGHGATRTVGRPPSRYTSELLAHDLERLVDALDLETFSLVGLSLGGLVAQEYALRHPERLRALVLADTWARTVNSPRQRRLGRALSPPVVGALLLLGTRPLARLSALGAPAGREHEVEAMAHATRATRRAEVVRLWRGLPVHDTADRLGRVVVPTLVIVGERERNRAQSDLLARLVPHAELAVLEGVGHNTNLLAPEAFNRTLRSFLDRVHGAPSRPRER